MSKSDIINIVLSVLGVLITFITYYSNLKKKIAEEAANAVNSSEIKGMKGEEKKEIAVKQIQSILPPGVRRIVPKKILEIAVEKAFEAMESYAKKQLDKKSQ